MGQSDRHQGDALGHSQQDLNVREALSAFVKAIRAARRYPAGSAVREASSLEFARAVRKALLHGPLVVRLGPDGPLLPGDGAEPVRVADLASTDLVLRDADPEALRGIVDNLVGDSTPADTPGAGGPGPRSEG